MPRQRLLLPQQRHSHQRILQLRSLSLRVLLHALNQRKLQPLHQPLLLPLLTRQRLPLPQHPPMPRQRLLLPQQRHSHQRILQLRSLSLRVLLHALNQRKLQPLHQPLLLPLLTRQRLLLPQHPPLPRQRLLLPQ
ncbi:hypothetical protein H257_12989 [Aphanomyces astaci]|uniref:Uncharacterized protein n=1 Tax=Aphanomyces astaci TaxID=112090 RepID=W4FYV0_APHAT|nr:hypothetical protein H257_12989 [Aphanomyces astaci]ETV71853.1 hypothetical protein H257_12989 [Aphanomyces astaci]|eukprot:XP_009838702.1 hypothetical protein H257_12989 [Aphanomyces astaci]